MATRYVVEARIYFSDLGNANNAYEHIRALAQHNAAHDVQVGAAHTETSWATLHECKVDEHNDPNVCATAISKQFEVREIGLVDGVLNSEGTAVLPPPGTEPEPPPDSPVIEWAAKQVVNPGDLRSYKGKIYRCIQGHTTQAGWQPPNTPALWAAV